MEGVSRGSEATQRRTFEYTSRAGFQRRGVPNTPFISSRHSRVDSTVCGESFVSAFNVICFPSTTYGRTALQYVARAGSTGPKSNRIDANHSAAFLLINYSLANNPSETSAADARYSVHRRVSTCPFECNFASGDKADVRTSIHSSTVSNDDLQNQDKLTWSPHHQLLSDPRQAFSFGRRDVTGKYSIPQPLGWQDGPRHQLAQAKRWWFGGSGGDPNM